MLDFRMRLRLNGFDYSTTGNYFITICTANFECTLSTIAEYNVQLTLIGKVIHSNLDRVADYYANISIDERVIMPNHLHCLLTIHDRSPRTSLPKVIGAFKAACTKDCRSGRLLACDKPLWQHSFHERIVRNDTERQKFAKYIMDNPVKWQLDSLNPDWRSR